MFQASVLYWPQGWPTSVRGSKLRADTTVPSLRGPIMPLAASDFFCQSKSSCSSASRLILMSTAPARKSRLRSPKCVKSPTFSVAALKR